MSSKDKGGNPEKSQDDQKKPQDQRRQTRYHVPRGRKILKKSSSYNLGSIITSTKFMKQSPREPSRIIAT